MKNWTRDARDGAEFTDLGEASEMDSVTLKITKDSNGTYGLRAIDQSEDDYSDTADEFGGFFTREELGESSEGLNQSGATQDTPPVIEDEKSRLRRIIMEHLRLPYQGAEIDKIQQLPSGELLVTGTAVETDQFNGRREKRFSTTYSPWEFSQIQKRSQQSESQNSGRIY